MARQGHNPATSLPELACKRRSCSRFADDVGAQLAWANRAKRGDRRERGFFKGLSRPETPDRPSLDSVLRTVRASRCAPTDRTAFLESLPRLGSDRLQASSYGFYRRHVPAASQLLAVARFVPWKGSYSLRSPCGPHCVRYFATLRSYSGFVEMQNPGNFSGVFYPIKRSS